MRYADFAEIDGDLQILADAKESELPMPPNAASLTILAAAYREKREECDELRKSGSEAISLYNKTSMKLETAMFGPESGEETYAKVKAERDALKTKRCDFRNELPQTENEKAYYEKFKNTLGELPTMAEWLASRNYIVDIVNCAVCGDLCMIPSDDPNGDIMNTPCPNCNKQTQ